MLYLLPWCWFAAFGASALSTQPVVVAISTTTQLPSVRISYLGIQFFFYHFSNCYLLSYDGDQRGNDEVERNAK